MLTKVVHVDREKLISILTTALQEPIGTEIYIPASNKKQQKDIHKCLIDELAIMAKIDPKDAASIVHRSSFKDQRFWVVITHVEPLLETFYIKDTSGVVHKKEVTGIKTEIS